MALRESGVTSSKRLNGHTIRRSGGYPHGWHLFDGRLVIDPKEQRVIRHIMQLYKQGTSKVDIAKYLNDKKIPTRSQGLWNESTIRSISARQKNLKQLEKCYE